MAEWPISDLPNNQSQKAHPPPEQNKTIWSIRGQQRYSGLRREKGHSGRGAGPFQRFSSPERLLIHSAGHRRPTQSHAGQGRPTLELRVTEATRNGGLKILEKKGLQRKGSHVAWNPWWRCLVTPRRTPWSGTAGRPGLTQPGQSALPGPMKWTQAWWHSD